MLYCYHIWDTRFVQWAKFAVFVALYPIIAMDSSTERSIVLGVTDGFSPCFSLIATFGACKIENWFFLISFRDVKQVAFHNQDRIPRYSPHGSAQSGLHFTLLNLFFISDLDPEAIKCATRSASGTLATRRSLSQNFLGIFTQNTSQVAGKRDLN